MAKLKYAFNKTLLNEGGFSNDPNDPGQMTYKGISRKYHSSLELWKIVDVVLLNNKTASNFYINEILNDNDNLQKHVKKFYRKYFWNKLKLDDVISQAFADTIFDFSVNIGLKNTAKIIQKIVGCKADGIIGPVSIKHINEYS